MNVTVFEKAPGRSARKIGQFQVSAKTVDGRAAEARGKIKREVRSLSHGPRGIVIYVHPRGKA